MLRLLFDCSIRVYQSCGALVNSGPFNENNSAPPGYGHEVYFLAWPLSYSTVVSAYLDHGGLGFSAQRYHP